MLINIQFLRLAAAMLVVVYHCSAHVRDTHLDQGALFAFFEAVGFAGVDIFFVISGFIMVWTTAGLGGRHQASLFLRRRVARIYSGYWPFYVLAVALFAVFSMEFLAQSQWLRSFFLWPANRLLIGVSWTLVYEMVFYLLFSLLMLAGSESRGRALWWLFGGIVAWALYSQFIRGAYDVGQLETINLYEYYLLSPYMAEFFGGALLARYLASRPGGSGWMPVILGSLAFAGGAAINLMAFDGNIDQGYYVFWRVLWFGGSACLIVAGLVRLEQAGVSAPRRLSLAGGGASYAIYLSHTLLLYFTQRLGLNRWLGEHSPLFAQSAYLVYAVAIFGFSMLFYRALERPLHRLFRSALRAG